MPPHPPPALWPSRRTPPPAPKIKVVANLPYNITKEFLKKMLPMGDQVSELSIMIQVRGLGHGAWETHCADAKAVGIDHRPWSSA